jgi:hypothetical protein
MAFDVSTLVSYVIENENLLVAKSLFGARTASLISEEGNVLTGIKFAEQINVLGTDAIFQSGAGCTRVSSGTTTITQRKVTVGNIAVVEDICVKDLRRTYLSKSMVKGSYEDTLAFEKEYTDLKSATIAKQDEIALWQGDLNSLNANLNKFDGLITLIDAATVSVNANLAIYTGVAPIATATGITVANVKSIVNAMWLALPADVTGRDDIRIFCGWDTFNKYINSFTDQNLFNFAPTGSEVSAANGVVIIPGTNYRLTAVHGLDGTNRLFATYMPNFYLGVDMENEEDTFVMMQDQFKDYLRFKCQFKQGVNVAFPDQIVSFKLV